MALVAKVLVTVSALLTVASAVHAGDPSTTPSVAEPAAVSVEIKNLQFVPGNIEITAGTTVTWINLDAVDHDVTSGVSVVGRKSRGMKQTRFPDEKFASGMFGENKSFSVTFDEKGEYDYYCNIHPFMVGKVLVR